MHRLVEEELRNCLGVESVERFGQARFYFSTSPTPAERFLRLRAPEKLYAVVLRCPAEALQLPSEQEEAEASLATLVACCSGWAAALETWRSFARSVGADREGQPRSFRATAKRAGRRAAHLSSNGIAEFIGEALADARGWRVDLHEFDVEVVVHLNDDHLIVCLPLLERGSSQQAHFAMPGLSQPVAWAMARSVEPAPGELVVDPMCGSGIVLLEAAQCWTGAYYLGFDRDRAQLDRSAGNLRNLSRDVAQCLCFGLGDASQLPLSDGSVDAIVCDLPFGKQYGSEEGNILLYPAAVLEFWRVLRPGNGRAVLLTNQANAARLGEALTSGCSGHWKVMCRRKVLLGHMEAVLFTAMHSTAPIGSGGDSLPQVSMRLPWEDHNEGRRRWTAMKAQLRQPMRLVTAGKKCNR
eukprot:TRINITY_DN50886_c0_g1_i1.p1 TRINITY_DN50886_c0_g1~~TRINITY_DN50886_c0_g1_i1.p1  ORF type:complete len:448 (-),score=106.17 TRINITY_DN50886_c0_g1_i1:41-1273(-)